MIRRKEILLWHIGDERAALPAVAGIAKSIIVDQASRHAAWRLQRSGHARGAPSHLRSRLKVYVVSGGVDATSWCSTRLRQEE
jgi:hypothetical protein